MDCFASLAMTEKNNRNDGIEPMELITMKSLETLHTTVSLARATQVKALTQALIELDAAPTKAAVLPGLVARLQAQGVTGVSAKSLYRKLAQAKAGGIRAILDGRLLRGSGGGLLRSPRNDVKHNEAFKDFWVTLVCQNKRKSAPAYRALLEMLARGDSIPGVGTWRDIFAKEHGGIYPAPDVACPWSPFTLDAPKGWTLRNLMRFIPSEFALTAARQGTAAAALTALPTVPFTRVGLAPCQVVELDDMWHEIKVALPGNKFAQRVAEFALIDRLTGHVIAYLPKPIRERDDGTLEVLRSEWSRYLIAYLLCHVGIPEAGCTIVGEHGTAKTTERSFVELIGQLTDGKVKLTAGGIMSTALAKGLPDGNHKGNPRKKGFLEGYHALLKNELGNTAGHIGGGRGKEPEEAYGLAKIDNNLRRLAADLELVRPGITARMRFPFMPWADFASLLQQAYNRLENRTWHQMDDWEACGFVVPEVRSSPTAGWARLDAMNERNRLAFHSLVQSGDVDYRMRRMSPREAWESRKGELKTIPAFAAPLILGESLARVCEVKREGVMIFRDETTLRKIQIVAQLANGEVLPKGQRFQVWVNPLAGEIAYVCDLAGKFLGTAKVMVATNPDDDSDASLRNLGIRQQAIAARMQELKPYIAAQRRAAAEAARVNAEAILSVDPVAVAQVEQKVLAGARTDDVSDEDLLPPEVPADTFEDEIY